MRLGSTDRLLREGDEAARCASPLDDLLFRRRERIVPAKPRPPVERLSIEGYTLSDFADPDRAGDWVSCPRPRCHNAAYFPVVYATAEEARRAVPARAQQFARAVLPRRRDPLAALVAKDPLEFYVHRIRATDIVGRDYRMQGCGIPNAIRELRNGRGDEPAWREIRLQRDVDHVEGALLPGPTSRGHLFLFRSAMHRIVEHEVLEQIVWSGEPV